METLDPRRREEARSIGEQAAEWLLRLEEPDAAMLESFTAWMTESPVHVEAFLRASAMDSLLGAVDPQRSIPVDRSWSESPAIDSIVPSQPEPAAEAPHAWAAPVHFTRRRFDRPVLRRPAFLAACLATAVAAFLILQSQGSLLSGWTRYTTDIGEQRVIEMSDGSVLHMNTASTVEVKFLGNERRIRLLDGEALFRVHRDPARPFRVFSGDSVIQALGTQFIVRRNAEGAVVSVIEGAVQVSGDPAQAQPSVRLDAGGQISIKHNSIVATSQPVDIARVAAWRQRRLIFVDEPLSTIAEEFNRYNRAPNLRIEGAATNQRRYAAAFDADDPESLLAILAKDPKLQVEQRQDEILIRSR